MKKIVVLTGAGISAESGIKTFRGSGGLWEDHEVTQVASPEGWARDPELVLRFYNERRAQLAECEPNYGHIGLAELEKDFDVEIITQNIDDLHEKAGSSKILHLHGELTKARSTTHSDDIIDIGYSDINIGDNCKRGAQLRPHIVWFGESVPAIEEAIIISQQADIFIVIGTSLNVYPAAGLLNYVGNDKPIFLIDPNTVPYSKPNITMIKKGASEGMRDLIAILKRDYL